MRIALIDPFFDDSHKQWAFGLRSHSRHDYELITQPPNHWKWKMSAGAIYSARKINSLKSPIDLILATDMVNVPLLKSQLNKQNINIPIALYFHENQISYPWSPTDSDVQLKRDHHYGLINFMSCLTANEIFFNSDYHSNSLLRSLPSFIGQFPKFAGREKFNEIERKSRVLPIGLDFDLTKKVKKINNEIPVILWNHRWEEDKNPDSFYKALTVMKNTSVPFKLALCGKQYGRIPDAFEKIKNSLREEIIHIGFAPSRTAYIDILRSSDILLVTSNQDFFGISTVEAIYYGCDPILPNRLAYPEHIPHETHDDHIYNDEDRMLQLLRLKLMNYNTFQSNQLSKYVEKYDWENLIEDYDLAFETVIAEMI